MHYVDLHIHSFYSDGTMSPAEIINEAEHIWLKAYVLSAIVLCIVQKELMSAMTAVF